MITKRQLKKEINNLSMRIEHLSNCLFKVATFLDFKTEMGILRNLEGDCVDAISYTYDAPDVSQRDIIEAILEELGKIAVMKKYEQQEERKEVKLVDKKDYLEARHLKVNIF